MKRSPALPPGGWIWPAAALIAALQPGPCLARAVSIRVAAQVITPARIAADEVIQTLVSSSPGVLTIRLPATAFGPSTGSAQTLTLTSTGTGTGESLTFRTDSAGLAVLSHLTQMESLSGQPLVLDASLPSTLLITGMVGGRAMQIVVRKVISGLDGAGYVDAVITYD